MNNICVIAHVRSSCENFISTINLERVVFNSFDVFYGRSYKLNLPHQRHVLKIYIETIGNKDIQDIIKSLKDYTIIYFKRSNMMKQFITKKMQDNLIGEYGKDYNQFSLDIDEYKSYVNIHQKYRDTLIQVMGNLQYITYDADINNFNINQQLFDLNCFKSHSFLDAFEEELSKRFITNYEDFKLKNHQQPIPQ